MKVPVYASDRLPGRLPSTGGQQMVSPIAEAIQQAGQQFQGLADVIKVRAEQRQQERDAADALAAFNDFRNRSREKMGELESLEGVNARGSSKAYLQWVDETINKTKSEKLQSDRQRLLFDRAVDDYRNTKLERVAAHEANQEKVYKKSVAEGDLALRLAEVADNPGDEKRVEAGIAQHAAFLRIQFPGQDTSADEIKAEATVRKAQLSAMLETDPVAADSLLEKVRPVLGADYGAIKRQVQAKVREKQEDMAYADLDAKFQGNPAAAARYILDPKNMPAVDLDTRKKLASVFEHKADRARIEADRAESNAFEDTAIKIIQAKRAGDFQTANRLLDSARGMKPSMVMTLESYIDKPVKAGTDTALKADLIKKIDTGEIARESDIMLYEGHGLTENDSQYLRKKITEKNAPPPDKTQRDFQYGRAVALFDVSVESAKAEDSGFSSKMKLFKPDFEVWLDSVRSDPTVKPDDIFRKAQEFIGSVEDPWNKPPSMQTKGQPSSLQKMIEQPPISQAAPEAPKEKPAGKKTLSKEKAKDFIKQAGGDRKKAEEMAKADGYDWGASL